MVDKSSEKKEYQAKEISVLEGLEGVRKRFDVLELSNKIKKKGDILVLSQELKIKPRILQEAAAEGRIRKIIPDIQKSKAAILAWLKTDREVRIFSDEYDLNNISARALIKLVRKWNNNIQKSPRTLINQEEHDLIIGSLLGDSSIRQREKNSCFRFSHSTKQADYAKFKKNLMNNFNISEFREVNRKIRNSFIHAIDFSTDTHPIFNYYRSLFYPDGKKVISRKILDQLTPRALAFWICDDGSYNNTQGYIVICTNAYGLEEHRLMKNYFIEKFGLNPTIGFRDGKYHYLRFKQDDSKKLINIIRPFIIDSMKYKIGKRND